MRKDTHIIMDQYNLVVIETQISNAAMNALFAVGVCILHPTAQAPFGISHLLLLLLIFFLSQPIAENKKIIDKRRINFRCVELHSLSLRAICVLKIHFIVVVIACVYTYIDRHPASVRFHLSRSHQIIIVIPSFFFLEEDLLYHENEPEEK